MEQLLRKKLKKAYPILMLTMTIASCKNSKDPEAEVHEIIPAVAKSVLSDITDTNVYDDIDLFKIEGVRKIEKPTTYPYIKVEDLSKTEKRVVYINSKSDSIERKYQIKGTYWTSSYEYRIDTNWVKVFEFVTPDKIIELDYFGRFDKTGYHLDDASETMGDKEITYSFWSETGPFIEPDVRLIDFVKKNAGVIITEDFENINGIMTIISNSFDRRTNIRFKADTTCYDVGNHSNFWFKKFGWDRKVKCN